MKSDKITRNYLNTPTSNIIAITYGIMSDEEILKREPSELTGTDMNPSAVGSIDSLVFGSNSSYYNCMKCGQTKDKNACMGHSGIAKLNAPVMNTTMVSTIINYLKIFCWKCGGLTLGNKKITLNKMVETLNSSLKKGVKCRNIIDYNKTEPVYCEELHPYVSEVKNSKCTIVMEQWQYDALTKKSSLLLKKELSDKNILDIFTRIRPEALKFLNIPKNLEPSVYINKYFYVPSNIIRADQTNLEDKKSKKNDINIHLISIMKKNNDFGNISELDVDNSKYQTQANALKRNILEMKTLTSTTQQIKPVAGFLASKKGLIRGSCLGFRVFRVGRLFIGNEPSAKLNEVIIPKFLAENLGIDEKVCEYNIDYLKMFVLNGVDKYPKCMSIVKKNGKSYNLAFKKNITLEIGDTVFRSIVDGDIVMMNRQPTLLKSNITAKIVKISSDVKMIKYNVIGCVLYSADFDGDEMNFIVPATKPAAFESDKSAGFQEAIISNARGMPVIGQVQDGVMGLALLTRDQTIFTRKEVLNLFSDIEVYPNIDKVFPEKAKTKNKDQIFFSGRDVLTLLFDFLNIQIYYNNLSNYYEDGRYAAYRNYSKTEIEVKIENGRFLSGVIDKKAIGTSSYGGLYHKIYNKYGPQKTMSVIWYTQQLAHKFLLNYGFTMSIGDFIVSEESIEKIKKIENSWLAESILAAENFYNGKLIPPSGKTVVEAHEIQQLNILDGASRHPQIIHEGIDYHNNRMYQCIYYGSKGKSDNFEEIVTAYGQNKINGKRLQKQINGRHSQFFTRDSTDPRANGYVSKPYFQGLDASDINSTSKTARNGLIEKALMTASSGTAYREAISSNESLILDNSRRLVYGHKIRQSLYGGDGIDPRLSFKSSLKSLEKNLEEYKELLEEYKRLVEDRDYYVKLRLNYETRTNEPFDKIGFIPVNFSVILEELLSLKSKEKINIDLKKVYNKIQSFIDRLPLLYMNKDYSLTIETKDIPICYKNSLLFFQMYLRFELCLKNIKKYNFTEEHVDLLLQKIQTTFINNLEDPGTCAGIRASQGIIEISTQQNLSAIHTKGDNHFENIKNTFHAKKTDKIPNPSMKIFFKEEFETNKEFVEEFATTIEMTSFKSVVNNYQIFFENIGNIVHPDYIKENNVVKEKMKFVQPPNDLLPWCIRFGISIEKIIAKKLSTEIITNELVVKYNNIYIVSEPMSFIRIYFRQNFIKKSIPLETSSIQIIAEEFLETIIRGVNGITTAFINEKKINLYDGEKKSKKIYFISTDGTNLSEIVLFEAVDPSRVYSNAMHEIESLIGICGARNAIVDSIRASLKGAHYTHYTVFADQMTCGNHVTGLDRSGSSERKASYGTLITDSHYLQQLRKAATKGVTDYITGPNSAFLYGSIPEVATNYNKIEINEDFVLEFNENKTKDLEDL